MKGNNELRLNAATMAEIVQQWLDREMPNAVSACEVADIDAEHNHSGAVTFVIKIGEVHAA